MATYGHIITLWRTILSHSAVFVNSFSAVYRGFFLGFFAFTPIFPVSPLLPFPKIRIFLTHRPNCAEICAEVIDFLENSGIIIYNR